MLRKSEAERYAELELSLRLIHRCCLHFNETKDDCYLLGVLSQLRALVSFKPWEKRQKGRTLKPLLLDLADKANVPLQLHSYPPKPERADPKLIAVIFGLQTWSVGPTDGFQPYTLREWVLVRAFHVESTKTYRSRNDVIRQLTEKGAVHYDEEVGEIVDSMRRVFSSRFNGIQFFILDTAKAVYCLGTRFLLFRQISSEGISDPASDERIQNLDRGFSESRVSMI